MTTETETIDCTPTWEFAASVYIEVLRNPDAGFYAVQTAKDEILRLARTVDQLNQNEP
jgi:hypothetical protein